MNSLVFAGYEKTTTVGLEAEVPNGHPEAKVLAGRTKTHLICPLAPQDISPSHAILWLKEFGIS